MADEQVAWRDATRFLEDVCSELKTGELLHGENFSLFEAMSALEVMDPKMDAGMATGDVKTVDEAIDKGLAPLDLTIPQLLNVMDQLLACEATWHSGHSLAQTVFSCLYLHKPERTAPNAILHAYCKAVRSTCNLIRTLVCIADVQEEEDFVAATFGFPLDSEPEGKGLAALNAVEEILMRQLKAAKGGASKGKSSDSNLLQVDPVLEESYCESFLTRLRFRKALHNALSHMDKPQLRGLETARKHIHTALEELSLMRLGTSSLKTANTLPNFANTLPNSANTSPNSANTSPNSAHPPPNSATPPSNSATPPGEGVEGVPSATASGVPALGFNESCNRRLLAPTPPRAIRIMSWQETLAHFEKLLVDFERACRVAEAKSLLELQHFIADFNLNHPGVVARSRLHAFLFPSEKLLCQRHLWEVVLDELRIPEGSLRADADVIGFASRAARPMKQLLRILCLNGARQRRKLARVLPEWDTLMLEAEFANEAPAVKDWVADTYNQVEQSWWKANVFSSWAIAQACRMMIMHLGLGFQQELYAPQEYLMLYWYLENLLHTLVQVLQLTDTHFEEHEQKLLEKSAEGKKKAKKRKPAKPLPNLELLRTQVLGHMCRAMVRLLAALTLAGRLPLLESPFNSEEERYEQRFAALQKVHCPEPLPYANFKQATDLTNFTPAELYDSSSVCLREARGALGELAQALAQTGEATAVAKAHYVREAKQLDQVWQRTDIALAILKRLGSKDKMQVAFDFSVHHMFPVTVVKKPDKPKG